MHSLFLFISFTILGSVSSQGKQIPPWWLRVAQKQGANACVVESVPGTDKEFWTECKFWLNRQICGQKTIIRFECCEGFERTNGEEGCPKVKPLKNLLQTAEAIGATSWADYIRQSGLASELETAGAYTLFVPTNEAFDKVKKSVKNQLDSYRGNPNNPILLYHILPTKLLSEDFMANLVVETRHPGYGLRINKYSNGMTTINCALLIRKDQQATNGVVHLVDTVLDPSIGILQNVVDLVQNDGRFTVMAQIMERSGYANVLRMHQEPVTVLVPSDEAFQKMPDSRRDKIINDREARLALLQHHVIPHVICESAITGEHRLRTMMSSSKLTFNCDISGTFVETTKMRNDFHLGKNGIVHVIDDVLLPDRAKNLVELAESRSLVTFVEMVRKAGLEDTLSHTGDYTFFVPDEDAWNELDPKILRRARENTEHAGALVRFMGSYGRHLTKSITDSQTYMSLDEENPIRLQVWRRALGAEDARILIPDLEAQNGVIHIINKIIMPFNQSVAEVLRGMRTHSFNTFLEILERITGQNPTLLNMRPGEDVFYTFFVPTDETFQALSQGHLSQLARDSQFQQQLIENHIAAGMFPAMAFEAGLVYTIEGKAKSFNIKKSNEGILSVNGGDILDSFLCANGVIHIIEKIFLPDGEIVSIAGGGRGSSRRSSHSTAVENVSGGMRDVLPAQKPETTILKKPTKASSKKRTEGNRLNGRHGSKRNGRRHHEDKDPDSLSHTTADTHRAAADPTYHTYSARSYTRTTDSRSQSRGSAQSSGTMLSLSSKKIEEVPDARKSKEHFSYVGLPYGNDVVGHTFNVETGLADDPFRSDRNISRVSSLNEPNSEQYSSPSDSYMTHNSRNYPPDSILVTSTGWDGQEHAAMVAPHAFTMDLTADGSEFVESVAPVEETTMTTTTTPKLKHYWRQKRHHRNNGSRRRHDKKNIRHRQEIE